MSFELKIKAKSLAAESKIINDEIAALKRINRRNMDFNRNFAENDDPAISKRVWRNKTKRYDIINNVNSLRNHNTGVVRREARATHLARAFLKNMPYRVVEHTRKPEKEYHFHWETIPRVLRLVQKYGDPEMVGNISQDAIQSWLAADRGKIS